MGASKTPPPRASAARPRRTGEDQPVVSSALRGKAAHSLANFLSKSPRADKEPGAGPRQRSARGAPLRDEHQQGDPARYEKPKSCSSLVEAAKAPSAGAESTAVQYNRLPRCAQAHEDRSPRAASPLHDAPPKVGNDNAEGMEGYLKLEYGRSMRHNRLGRRPEAGSAGRPSSRPAARPAPRPAWVQDESRGAVPCVGRAERQERTPTPQTKRRSEYSGGNSSFAKSLAMQQNQQVFRMEHADFSERSSSMPLHSAFNPVTHAELRRASPGASPPEGAGMSSSDTNRAVMRPRLDERTNNSIRVGGILRNAGLEDAKLIRMYRERHEKPFVDLCTAFAQIREAQCQDTRRLKQQVGRQVSSGMASLLQWDPSSRTPPAGVRSLSPRRPSHSPRVVRSPQDSSGMAGILSPPAAWASPRPRSASPARGARGASRSPPGRSPRLA